MSDHIDTKCVEKKKNKKKNKLPKEKPEKIDKIFTITNLLVKFH